MSSETFPITPEFAWVETINYPVIKTPFESGTVQLRARHSKGTRHWTLRWNHATVDEAEQLEAFANEHVADSFSYTVADKKARPYAAPTLAQVAGGALGSRTRYAKFTWSDSSDNETLACVNSDSLAISANYLLTVTVPEFQENVTKAWVYVGPSDSVYYKQVTAITTSAGTWTEPAGGYATGTDSPPTTATFTETATVHFLEDSISIVKIHANYYSMQVKLEEVL